MSVYNGEPYLNAAIESILNQTFTDFEFLIIDAFSNQKSLDKKHAGVGMAKAANW